MIFQIIVHLDAVMLLKVAIVFPATSPTLNPAFAGNYTANYLHRFTYFNHHFNVVFLLKLVIVVLPPTPDWFILPSSMVMVFPQNLLQHAYPFTRTMGK